jgi:hypothetical protein
MKLVLGALFAVLVSAAAHGQSPLLGQAVDLPALEKELSTNGLQGWVHGAAPEFDQYVFTWRDPNDFFLHFEFPLITANPAVKAELAKLGRHDEIVVKGKFASLHAPIKHIRLKSVQVVTKFSSGIKVPHYQREAKLPDDLVGKSELVGKVHAVVEDGKILVIEYKDAVVPVYVADNTHSKDLFRNDKIRLHYKLRQHPGSPSHVELDSTAAKPIEVIEHLVDLHGKPAVVEGTLVMFPKSPQVKFNVFALQVTDKDGVKREHTLVNFDDIAVFEAIRDKLQALWDSEPTGVVDGRNKLLNTKIRLRATGTGNVVDPGQANPQVLLKSEADLVRL